MMDDKIELLIRELAEKIGTTGDNLWDALLQQAAITATTDILAIAGWAALLWFSFQVMRNKTKVPTKTEENMYPRAEWTEELAIIAWLIWGCACAFIIVIVGTNLSTIVSAILNPEYWALKQILGR